MSRNTAVSPLVQAANERLHQRRTQLTQNKPKTQVPPWQAVPAAEETVANLPDHLGWQNAALTQILKRQKSARRAPSTTIWGAAEADALLEGATAPSNKKRSTIRIYPDIVLASLQADMASLARIWLLAKHIDVEGKGVLRVANLRNNLTEKTSSLFLYGKRRLRTLLAKGNGIFWVLDSHRRIWLRSYHKVARYFQIPKLSLRPVPIPLESLTNNIFTARAWFYASYHLGRGAAPISRAAIEQATGVDPQTQRKYEAKVGIDARFNYAIADKLSAEAVEEYAWQRGGGSFSFEDTRGYHGEKKGCYVAWQLPNTYFIDGQYCSRGMQKRINRSLKHLLLEKGTTGTEQRAQRVRTYFSTAKAAVLSKTKAPMKYWERKDINRAGIWQVMIDG